MSRDLLAGRPARTSTPVPGHWLLDLPSLSPQIHIRQYVSASPVSAETSLNSLLDAACDDAIERGWRKVNGGEAGFERGVAGVLEGGCATVIAGEGGMRELWHFQITIEGGMNEPLQGVEGLEEVFPQLAPFHPADLLHCDKHGNDTACLATRSAVEKACELNMTQDEGIKRYWTYLRNAIFEKLAWRSGRRVDLGTRAIQGVDIGLHAMPHDKLLLTVTPRASPTASTSLQPKTFVLQPLGLPALLLGPKQLSTAQDEHLCSMLDAGFGHAWKDGRAKMQLDAQIGGRRWSDWSVYWVPTDHLGVKIDPLGEQWKDGQGIVTIWPTHLARPYRQSTVVAHNRNQLIPPPFSFPTPSDAMSIATNLFDHLSTAQEATSPTNTIAQVATPLDTVDGESPPFEYEEAARTSPIEEDGGSDVDDLFSAGSESPGPPEPLEDVDDDQDLVMEAEVLSSSEAVINENNEKKVYDLNDDVDMSSPPRFEYPPDPPLRGTQEESNMVTEDDFAFFDSPGPGATEPVETPLQIDFMELVDLPQALPDENEHLFGEPLPIVKADVNVAAPLEGETTPSGPEDTVAELGDTEMPDVTTHDPTARKNSEHDHQIFLAESYPPVFNQDVDIIPSSFEPIILPHHTASRLAPYAPPTPVPTPPALRLDALSRLKPPKVDTMDYAADWDLSSVESEVEDDDYGYTPPTPISEMDSEDDSTEKKIPGKVKGGGGKRDEVDWDGIRCISAEWVVIVHQKEVIGKLSRHWLSSWTSDTLNEVNKEGSTSVDRKGILDVESLQKLDLDRFAIEMIANRHLRKHLIVDSAYDSRLVGEPLAAVGVDLAVLNGLAADNSTTSVYHPQLLPECLVHAGYANYVMQLSASGLRYWSELGLQAVGGRKDISGLVICEVGEGIVRVAKAFLRRMGKVFDTYRLGAHTVGETPGSVDGVISVPENAFADTIAGNLSRDLNNTVVYVLLQDIKAATLERLLSITPTSKTAIIHFLHPSSVQARNTPDIAFEIYDRIPVLLRPTTNLLNTICPTYLPHPHFTIAPDEAPKIEFTLQWPIRNYEVMNKWRWVHFGYVVDWESGVGLGFVVDENGEGWEVKVWKGLGLGEEVVQRVWDWFVGVSEGWSVQWRGSISCLGGMKKEEVAAWTQVLGSTSIPITLLIAEVPSECSTQHFPRLPIPNAPPGMYADPTTKITDATLSAHTMAYCFRTPLPLRSSSECIIPKTSFLLSIALSQGEGYATTRYHVLRHRSVVGREGEEVEKVLGREFHKLICLGRGRFGFEGVLPVHLEGVRLVLEGSKGFAELSG